MNFLEDNAELVNKGMGFLMDYGPKVIGAIVVFIIGKWIIGKIVRVVEAALSKNNMDVSLSRYLGKIIRVVLLLLLIMTVAGMVGIETTSFIAILGASTLAIGMALQGSLANFAGGFLLLVFRPFKVGDYIVSDGEEGVVQEIGVFCTTLTTLDNRRIILPNGPLAGGKMTNVGVESNRRVDLSIGIGYGDDFNKAKTAIMEMAKGDNRILSEPAPFAGITDFGDSSVNLTVRVWCKSSDYWDVFFDTNQRLKECLDKAGVSIPFPQREVNIISDNK